MTIIEVSEALDTLAVNTDPSQAVRDPAVEDDVAESSQVEGLST